VGRGFLKEVSEAEWLGFNVEGKPYSKTQYPQPSGVKLSMLHIAPLNWIAILLDSLEFTLHSPRTPSRMKEI